MNHYPHHIGDFDAATRHLSRLERAIYRDMRDRYCLQETPLDGADFNLLARRLLCVTPEEIAALQFVLDEFFELSPEGLWINAECDQIVAAYRAQQAGNGDKKGNEKERKTRSRARRAAMFSALREAGIVLPYDTKMPELYRLCRDNNIPIPADAPRTGQVTPGDGTGHGQVTPSDALGTGKPEPEPKPSIPPNPPAGGAGAGQGHVTGPGPVGQGGVGQPPPRGQVGQQGGGMPSPAAVTTATALGAFFPEHRRTRLAQVAQRIAELEAEGAVTGAALLEAAARQEAALARDDGKACPSVLRWLRERRWLDSVTAPVTAQGVTGHWRESRSGIEAMGERVGMLPYEQQPGLRLLSDYLAEVDRRLAGQAEGVAA